MKKFFNVKSKKILLVTLLCICLLGLSSCSSKNDSKNNESSNETTEITELKTTTYFIQIDGVKYTLPFKVSELEKAGFNLSEYKKKTPALATNENSHFWLNKNGIIYSFNVLNPNDTSTNIDDCIIHHMKLDATCYPNSDAMILEGIKYGTKEEDIKKICKMYESTTQDSEDGNKIYKIAAINGKGYRIDINEDCIVTYFEVYNNNSAELHSIEIIEQNGN